MTETALITGANKGIGYEIARQLADHGFTVLVGARDRERGETAVAKLRAGGADAQLVPLDVTDPDSVARAAATIEADFGALDVLVNNAAIAGPYEGDGKPSSTTLPTLRQVFETNVFGVVAVTNAMLPLLRRAPAARIVNVSSEVGSLTMTTDPDGPLWPMAAIPYPTSKTALNMITAQYAKELWDTPIRVNAVNPGYTATDLNGHSGFRTPAQGAEPIVAVLTAPAGGPSGQFTGFRWGAADGAEFGSLPW
ncbi:SDR family oxidoreductase [Nocardia sp. alder85J]|uniref:SDR family oxidoreductase n=1 Tax=Nocardia sp. alder85J TaxID=2862949 RepID=UPI001CD60E31|nr:SDR family oxidoreductase [Nocardia sp. alder85J]MCX4093453.1 SDR family oxidoreductase [Nocardia sp. alder85J]